MNRVTITLHIDLPEGVIPDVDYKQGKPASADSVLGIYADEVPPEPPYVLTSPPQVYDRLEQVPAPAQNTAVPVPFCQQHGDMKRYPAGVNKAGKPFSASWRCPVAGCKTRPIWDRDAA